jgi:hypothetical protein
LNFRHTPTESCLLASFILKHALASLEPPRKANPFLPFLNPTRSNKEMSWPCLRIFAAVPELLVRTFAAVLELVVRWVQPRVGTLCPSMSASQATMTTPTATGS